jgi:DNA replication protein DnaC
MPRRRSTRSFFCFARSSSRRSRAPPKTSHTKPSAKDGASDSTFIISSSSKSTNENSVASIASNERATCPQRRHSRRSTKVSSPRRSKNFCPRSAKATSSSAATTSLAFGLPGRGKTHVVCAIGHELVRRGRRVWFTPTFALVQMLLAAKRDLRLEKELAALDVFDVVILDDIGYVQQDRDEMEVLFTFLAQRYERRSVILTSNLLFRDWDRIFKDPMTTAAAIDRLVHHAVILEMSGPSIRETEAKKRGTATTTTTPTTTTKPQSDKQIDGEV